MANTIFHKNKNEFQVNPDNSYRGTSAIIKALFFILVAASPIALFGYVIYHSNGLNIYMDTPVGDGKIWDALQVPNGQWIFIFYWLGISLLVITVVLTLLLGVVVRNTKVKSLKTTYIVVLISCAVLGILFAALSQYFYSKVSDFGAYEKKTNPADKLAIYQGANQDGIAYKMHEDSANLMDWEKSTVVWWIFFVQAIVLFGVSIFLQNTIYNHQEVSDYDKYISDVKKDDEELSFSRIGKAFRSIFKNSDKNIALFLIIVALIIVIPSFVYSILCSVDGTNLSAMINWGYRAPVLLQDLDPQRSKTLALAAEDPNVIDNLINYLDTTDRFGTLFTAVSLPIIVEGVVIATAFFFVAILLRGRNVSNRIFIVETIVLGTELLVLVSVCLTSKVFIHRLQDYMSAGGINKEHMDWSVMSVLEYHIPNLQGLFGMGHNKATEWAGFSIEWLSLPASIAESIIAYAFIFGSFTFITTDIYKLGYFKKINKFNYKKGILNN